METIAAFRQVLGQPDLEPTYSFWQTGGTSLMAIQVSSILSISTELIYSYPTARSLSLHLSGQYLVQIIHLYSLDLWMSCYMNKLSSETRCNVAGISRCVAGMLPSWLRCFICLSFVWPNKRVFSSCIRYLSTRHRIGPTAHHGILSIEPYIRFISLLPFFQIIQENSILTLSLKQQKHFEVMRYAWFHIKCCETSPAQIQNAQISRAILLSSSRVIIL